MKLLALTILATVLSSQAFGSIKNSDLEPRHQELLEKVVAEKCQINAGSITQISSDKEVISVDNGVKDYAFTTVLEVSYRVDQNYFDTYTITVGTFFADAYDHSSNNWGVYSLDYVSECSVR